MTVADDLATLRGFFDPTLGHDDPFRQALARVEAEIARLAESREKERRLVDEWTGEAATQRERAEAAEAEAARLRDGLRRTKEVLTAVETIVSRQRFDLDPEVRSLRIPVRDARHRALLAEDGAAHEAPLGSDDMYPESAA